MVTKELLDYIIYQLEKKESWDKIRTDLVNNGWTNEILEEAYSKISIIRPDFKLERNLVQPTSAINLDDVVVTGVNPENSTKFNDISVDDVVFENNNPPQEVKNSGAMSAELMEQAPMEMLNIDQAFDPSKNNEGEEKKGVYSKPGVDTNQNGKNLFYGPQNIQNNNLRKEEGRISVPVTAIEVPKKNVLNGEKNSPIEAKKDIDSNPFFPLNNKMASGANPVNSLSQSTIKPISGTGSAGTKKKNSLLLILLLIFFIILILGSTAFAYYNFVGREAITAKLLNNSKLLSSGDFKADISFDFQPSEKLKNQLVSEKGIDPNSIQSQKVQALVTGKFNYKNIDNAKLETLINLNSKSSSNEDYSVDFEYKITDNIFYGKLNSLKMPNPYQEYVDRSELKNYFDKWIMYTLPSKNGESFSKGFLTEMNKGNESLLKDTANASQALNFNIVGFESVEGKYCLKYNVSLNKEKLKEVILSSANDTAKTLTDQASKDEFQSNLKNFNENYDSFYDSYLKNIDLNVWVGILDFYVYKTNVDLSGDIDGTKFSFIGNFVFTNHNADLTIVAPEYTSDWGDVMSKIMGVSVSPDATMNTVNDNEIKAAMTQAKLVADKYKLNRKNYSDLELSVEMRRVIQDDINKWGGDAAKIFTSNDKYCLSKKLPDTNTNWCIDFLGFMNIGECNKESLSCNGSTEIVNPVTNPTVPNPVDPSIPVNPTPIPAPIPTPAPIEDKNADVKELINQLKSSLDAQKVAKGTYLGVVSSKDGIALIKEINKEGEAIIIATSKEKYCTMKKFSDGIYYCVDNTGFIGAESGCSNKTFVCKAEVAN